MKFTCPRSQFWESIGHYKTQGGGLPREADGSIEGPEGDKLLGGANPFGNSLFTPRNWKIVDELKSISGEVGLFTPALRQQVIFGGCSVNA